ncbi:MAG: hypothetical protein L0H53_13135 [Candidatus Nitrosocosmicus sp.]|nr:hypothetical protein [Candidatus Nitrosocosmicus sp.]MDN5869085.1 hypothetical protein [Candidatus Nitrosocosmicus sp.]
MKSEKQLVFGVITVLILAATISTTLLLQQSANAIFCVVKKESIDSLRENDQTTLNEQLCESGLVLGNRAPMATSGENLYVTWWGNNTGNWEVFFKASTDGGNTFGDKVNLSNSTDADSQDAEIAASGDNVYVSWWERNQTSNEAVLRISTDNGQTFGPLLQLAVNGTISGGGEEGEGE